VLIFRNGDGTYTAKVADFGFSTHFNSEQGDLIQMPMSMPWTAPEHHSRLFIPESAKVMDVYSFGMLCLWLLFDKAPSRAGTNNRAFSFEAKNWKENEDLLLSWKMNKLLDWAIQLIANSASIKDEMKTCLTRFFQYSLQPDSKKRNADWDCLLRLLAPAQ
jgi:serine/threonine protein kinase